MIWRSLLGFFRQLWRALDAMRRAVHLLLMLFVLGVIILALSSRPARLPEAFTLVVSPQGILVEQFSGDPVSRALDSARGLVRNQTLVSELVEAIDAAAEDRRVKVLHLVLDDFDGGSIDKLEQVTAALGRFRASDKLVITSGAGFGEAQYYLAAHADELYLDPLGGVVFQGFGLFRSYFHSALEKLSVDWYVFHAGEAKSAADPFVRDDMSAAERENLTPVVEGLWRAWREAVAQARGVEPELLDDYVNRFLPRMRAAGGDTARMALDAGLVDGVRAVNEIEERLAEAGGRNRRGHYVGVHAEDYLVSLHARQGLTRAADQERPRVALIVARGDILPGEQPSGMIGDVTLRTLFEEVRKDTSLRALVLRVDSGGGSQAASEAIMRELALLRAAGKPVVVSMGSVAASGGYMIALPADEVWAHPTTVTGSIGVVAAVPNFGRLLERIGVHVDGVGTHALSGEFRLDRSFGPDAMDIIEVMVDGAYERFLGQVAEARGLSEDKVREVAEGQVWLGQAALEFGLVDRLGNLDDALRAAAEIAGLPEDFEVERIEPELTFRDRLMIALVSAGARVGFTAWPGSWIDRLPGPVRAIAAGFERLERYADPRGLYYHCLCAVH